MSKLQQRPLWVAPIVVAGGLFLGAGAARAEPASDAVKTADPYTDPDNDTAPKHPGLFTDIKDYYTAPLHWDLKDWAYFGGAIGLVAAAHHYDSQVRTHFIKQGAEPIGTKTNDLQDFVPTIAAIGGTWLYSNIIDSGPGHHEAWNMAEAAGLSIGTSYLFKFAAGRERSRDFKRFNPRGAQTAPRADPLPASGERERKRGHAAAGVTASSESYSAETSRPV